MNPTLELVAVSLVLLAAASYLLRRYLHTRGAACSTNPSCNTCEGAETAQRSPEGTNRLVQLGAPKGRRAQNN